MNDRTSHLRVIGERASETRPEAIPLRQRRCRAGHHDFPLDHWLPPSPVPTGVTVMFASEGRYKLVELCSACQAVTGVTYTHPGGEIDGHLRRHIVYSREWVRMAQDAPRGRALMRDSLYDAGRPQLQAFLGRAITSVAVDAREHTRPSVAPVHFSGA